MRGKSPEEFADTLLNEGKRREEEALASQGRIESYVNPTLRGRSRMMPFSVDVWCEGEKEGSPEEEPKKVGPIRGWINRAIVSRLPF
jgi:hypothetical protein